MKSGRRFRSSPSFGATPDPSPAARAPPHRIPGPIVAPVSSSAAATTAPRSTCPCRRNAQGRPDFSRYALVGATLDETNGRPNRYVELSKVRLLSRFGENISSEAEVSWLVPPDSGGCQAEIVNPAVAMWPNQPFVSWVASEKKEINGKPLIE